MQCQMRNVVMRCGTMVWYMWNMVVCCEDVKCGCGIPSDWCGMVWRRHIRHGGDVKWWLKCSVGCVVLWDSGMWNLYLNVERCMAWNVGTVWNGVPRCDAVERFDRYEMWFDVSFMCNVVRCEFCHFRRDWNAKCVMWNMVWCGNEVWCPGMWNVA